MSTETTRLSAVAGSIESAYEAAVCQVEPSDIVYVVEYATAAALASYDQVERARRTHLGDHRTPVATVAVEALTEPDAALAVELTAFPGGGRLVEASDGVLRVADDIVYLPSIHPREGDFRTQYRNCLERAGDLLKAAGLGLDALVQTTDYTATATRTEYRRCGRPRKELLSPPYPGAAGILVDQPVFPGSMVSLDAIASTAALRGVNPGWRRYETLTYTPGVLAGQTLFMSGFGALEPATQKAVFDGDLLAQAEFTYAGISAVLREAGGGTVTRLIEYITPAAVAAYPAVAEVRRKYFGDTAALSSVVCSALLRPEFLIEVVPTAVMP